MTTNRTSWMLGAAMALGLAGAMRAAEEGAKAPAAAAPAAEAAAASTLDNLQAAYNGESNAKERYLAYAAKADGEGYASVATLFRAAADSEDVHARNFADQIKKLNAEPKATVVKPEAGTTKENLEAALKGETYEQTTLYPAFFKKAEADKNPGAAMFFKAAMAAETEHTRFYREALNGLDDWKQSGKAFAVCGVCGYTVMGAPPEKCPVCASPRSKFKIFK